MTPALFLFLFSTTCSVVSFFFAVSAALFGYTVLIVLILIVWLVLALYYPFVLPYLFSVAVFSLFNGIFTERQLASARIGVILLLAGSIIYYAKLFDGNGTSKLPWTESLPWSMGLQITSDTLHIFQNVGLILTLSSSLLTWDPHYALRYVFPIHTHFPKVLQLQLTTKTKTKIMSRRPKKYRTRHLILSRVLAILR